jgi:hypothetical protein
MRLHALRYIVRFTFRDYLPLLRAYPRHPIHTLRYHYLPRVKAEWRWQRGLDYHGPHISRHGTLGEAMRAAEDSLER